MKFLIHIFFLILCGTALIAQAPQQINYQGVLTDGSGAIVPDGNYNLTFAIYDAPVAGTNLWTDTFNNVPTENGVFNVTLGSGAALNINFDAPYWIGIAVGGGAELTPRIALTSSPYSIRTKLIEITDAAGQSAISAINTATAGTINAARLQSSVTTQGNTFNGNNQLLQLDASGDVPAVNLPDPLPAVSGANLTNLDASDLASGTIPDARIPNPLPALSGTNLTNLDASDLASGTVPTVRLGSGTADNTTFLRGDNTWAAPAGGGTVTSNNTLSGDGSGGAPLGINLGSSNTWTANQTFAGSFLFAANARIALTNNDNNARDIRFQEPSGSGSGYIGWRAPSVTNNGNYVYPAVVGSVGQVLTIASTGAFGDSATTTWTTVGGGGGFTPTKPVRAYATAAQTVNDETTAKVNFSTETFDSDNLFDLTADEFTAPSDGYYMVTGSVGIVNNFATSIEAHIYKNGSLHTKGPGQLGNANVSRYVNVCDIVFLNTNDTIDLRIYVDTSDGSTRDTAPSSDTVFLSITKVSD